MCRQSSSFLSIKCCRFAVIYTALYILYVCASAVEIWYLSLYCNECDRATSEREVFYFSHAHTHTRAPHALLLLGYANSNDKLMLKAVKIFEQRLR